MVNFTVAICTYNGERRLPAVLEGLRSQRHTDSFAWEVIVVDNNSHDNTAAVVRSYQQGWLPSVPLIYTFEPQQGIAFARRHAIRLAKGPLIGFLDDDNWPAPDWVAEAYQFGCRYPQVGAYGSHIDPHYESPPPPGIEAIACCLAIVNRGTTAHPYPPEEWRFPAGAGLVIRQRAWVESQPPAPLLAGVCGDHLQSKGEDLESLTYLRRAGWEIWHNAAMRIVHAIPRHRLEADYLLRLFQGIGLSRYPTRKIRYRPWQWPVMALLYLIGDAKKLISHLLRHPHPKDIITRCQRTLLIHSLISPFHHKP